MILARHGQTQWNAERRLQGSLDSPLTDIGVQQAQLVGRTLQLELPMDCELVSSNKSRAIETRNIIAEVLHTRSMSSDSRLDEMNFGTHEGRTLSERQNDRELHADIQRRNKNKFHTPLPGGENYADVEIRVRDYFQQSGTDFRVIVAHEAVNRMILKVLGDVSEDASMEIIQPNDVIYMVMDGEISHRRLGEGNDWKTGIMRR